MKYQLLFLLFFFSATTLYAQNEEEQDSKFGYTGFVDTYYLYNFNKPASKINTARVFDWRDNSISVGMVQTQMNYTQGALKIVGDLTFGPSANIANYGNAIAGTGLILKQAYIAYQFNDRIRLTVGQYGTHMGYEPVESTLNMNYSVSFQFAYGPIYHTGIKIDYQLTDNLSFQAGVVNGWDELLDANDRKTITLQVATTAIPSMELALNWIGGDEYNSPANLGTYRGSYTHLFDLMAKYQVSDNFRLGINSGYGSFRTASVFLTSDPHSHDGNWWAGALYIQYFPSDAVGLGFRGEMLLDDGNLRSDLGSMNGLTFTVSYQLAENFVIKPELRIDTSKDEIFETADGGGNTSQPTLGVAFIGKF